MKTHSKEAHLLAEAILKASGSSLKYYSLERIRDDILEMAQAGIDSARAPLIESLKWALEELDNISCYAVDSYTNAGVREFRKKEEIAKSVLLAAEHK